MYSVIVVGTDGSPTAERALGHAMDLAAVNASTVHIVSAYRTNMTTGTVGTPAEHWHVDTQVRIDAILDSAAARARARGLHAEIHAVQGDPADAIVNVAKEVKADAVIVGNKGMRGTKRFLLGSVPNKVAHGAPCTVVIVKTT
jgi:nucleotide-binding universal stress UspA family protein